MAIIDDPEQHEAAALARMVPSFAGCHVLEIGSGEGRVTRKYARDAARVIAIDTDAEGISELRRELPFVDARVVGVHDLELPPHSVDIVVFAWSLWWIVTEGMVDALRRARGWLRRTGFLIDLHPTSAIAAVIVGDTIAGPLQTGSAPTRHQEATDAIASVVRERFFTQDDEMEFEFSTYADTLEELQEHILEDRRESRIGDDTMARAQALLHNAHGVKPRVRERVSASRLLPRGH